MTKFRRFWNWVVKSLEVMRQRVNNRASWTCLKQTFYGIPKLIWNFYIQTTLTASSGSFNVKLTSVYLHWKCKFVQCDIPRTGLYMLNYDHRTMPIRSICRVINTLFNFSSVNSILGLYPIVWLCCSNFVMLILLQQVVAL